MSTNPPSPRSASVSPEFLRRVRRLDKLARGTIITGGVGIIAAVAGIFLLIVGVALPLFKSASVRPVSTLAFAQPETILQAGLDDYGQYAFALRSTGVVTGVSQDGKPAFEKALDKPGAADATLLDAEPSGHNRFTCRWSDGSASLVAVEFKPLFDAAGTRRIDAQVRTLVALPAAAPAATATRIARTEEGSVRVDLLEDGSFRLQRQTEKEDFLGNKTAETRTGALKPEWEGRVTAFTLDTEGNRLYAGTDRGGLGVWTIGNPEKVRQDDLQTLPGGLGVARLRLVFGDNSLAVADSAGGLATWSMVRRSPDAPAKNLTAIHTLRGSASGIAGVAASTRSKSLFTLTGDGAVQGDHMTSGRALWATAAEGALRAFGVDGRDAGLLTVRADGRATVHRIDCPHPEVSLGSLFGKVWYEGADEPAHVWQSSAGTDDYEPKLGLVPLISGTLKGTLYSLLFAGPLAILGALYVSQFMAPAWRRTVKPAVEIMAAVPSVVIGFLAGLWLAPLLEDRLPGVFCMLVVVPATVVAYIAVHGRIRRLPLLRSLENGLEFIGLIPVVLLGVWVSLAVGGWLEQALMAGDFRQWMFQTLDVRVDQRNAVVIAFALGFTVTPVVFTLADDALTAVPKNLTAASLALGASRWQTAWRVVLPSASPGIFAAVMIGIGRAVGETMIVLMATGNTPITDWSPFNGMRTLSANIAVEIPEAPHNSTLYRTLFLSGCVLFAFTFSLNTVAELIRIRLRRKYGNY